MRTGTFLKTIFFFFWMGYSHDHVRTSLCTDQHLRPYWQASQPSPITIIYFSSLNRSQQMEEASRIIGEGFHAFHAIGPVSPNSSQGTKDAFAQLLDVAHQGSGQILSHVTGLVEATDLNVQLTDGSFNNSGTWREFCHAIQIMFAD